MRGAEELQRLWRADIEAAKLEINAGQEGQFRPEDEKPRSLLQKVMRAVKR